MSYKATNWAYDLPLIGPQKFVLVALADMADEQNSCYPGQLRLAVMTGFSEKTVRRALISLEGSGLLSREHRHGAFGYRTSDRYRLNVGAQMLEVLPVTVPSGQSAQWSHSPSLPVTQSIPTGHSDRTVEPSVEPLEESLDKDIVQSEFDEWWALYPRKQGKADAFKAFKAARKSHELKTLTAGAQAYALLSIGIEKNYLKLPAGWLRGERWNDEPVESVDPYAGKRIIGGGRVTPIRAEDRECPVHSGYPLPCDACKRELLEGRAF